MNLTKNPMLGMTSFGVQLPQYRAEGWVGGSVGRGAGHSSNATDSLLFPRFSGFFCINVSPFNVHSLGQFPET